MLATSEVHGVASAAGQRAKKQAAYRRGLDAEDRAASMLTKRGYEILGRRFRSPAGEIDLVAAKGAHLAFVEVKSRRTIDEAAWSVTPRQQRRITDAAGYWLQNFPEYADSDISFDAVLFAPHSSEYIADAFGI